MTTILIIAAALCGLFLLMLTVLVTLILLHLHRSAIPTELAWCPHTNEEDALWEGSA
ncbi:hypothetical protein [Chitinophaga sp. YIM B06452]|uniref:hypothetical protein n=1 Tax=Chitinophaga sp. YIM B06452 TaxID=3082158 RepID=UPI0031FF2130